MESSIGFIARGKVGPSGYGLICGIGKSPDGAVMDAHLRGIGTEEIMSVSRERGVDRLVSARDALEALDESRKAEPDYEIVDDPGDLEDYRQKGWREALVALRKRLRVEHVYTVTVQRECEGLLTVHPGKRDVADTAPPDTFPRGYKKWKEGFHFALDKVQNILLGTPTTETEWVRREIELMRDSKWETEAES